ncbi:MAG: hypothetical protein H0W50_09905 [Parachlamydiaceae bacterium]|nr:hypothetical protein [Parachlamydiaceae bacterium]
MTHTYFNNCPDYYPIDFNKNNYQRNLDTLLSSVGSLGVKHHSFIRLGWIGRIFNAVAWVFGFKDITNSPRINGEILKFLHYGVLHKLIDNNLQNQFQYLSVQGWVAPEAKNAVDVLSKRNIATAEKLHCIKEQLSNYYTKNEQQLCPAFWKRRTSFPSVPLYKSSPFGTSHLFKAATTTEPSKWKKSLNHITWAIALGDKDLNFQKECFSALEILLKRSSNVYNNATHLIPFIARLAKKCITEENDYAAAEKYLTLSIKKFEAYQSQSLQWQLKKIFFKQQNWTKLTFYVEEFTKKFSENERKKKCHYKLTALAKGIATIYQLKNYPYQTIDYLKKAAEYAPEDESIPKEISSIYKKMACSATKEEAINLLKNALKFDLNDQSISKTIASIYIQMASSTTNCTTAIELLMEASAYDCEGQSIPLKLASLYIQIGNVILKKNSPLIAMTGSFFKLRQSASPKRFYKQAYNICPNVEGAHIQWLISDYEQQKAFDASFDLYKEVSQLHPNYNYRLNSCTEHAYQNKKNGDFQRAYELFMLSHKFEPNNFSIKEEIVSLGLNLAKSYEENMPLVAVEYLIKIRPFVRYIEQDSNTTFGSHSPLPKINENDLEELIGLISCKYAYNRALQFVDECRISSMATSLRDDDLFEQNKFEHKEQIEAAVVWFQKALLANPRSAEAHFELASFFKYFEVENVDILSHYQKAVELKPLNYIYKLCLSNTRGELGFRDGINNVIKTLINPPEDCLKIYSNWMENYYLIKEDRFFTVDPHNMTCVAK